MSSGKVFELSDYKSKWIEWEHFPAVTVVFLEAQDTSEVSKIAQHLIQGMTQPNAANYNRAFLLFNEENFNTARNLVTYFKEEISDFELLVEWVDFSENRNVYLYAGLNEIPLRPDEKFAILCLSPSRLKQAKRLNLYVEANV